MVLRRLTRSTILVTAVVLLAVGAAACGDDDGDGSRAARDGDKKEMTLRIGSGIKIPSPVHAPYLAVPEARGYWTQEGLTVERVHFDSGTTVIQAIVAGKVDGGTSGTASLFPAIAQGVEVPSFYNHTTGTILSLVVPEGSPLQEPKDLIGKTIGLLALDAAVIPTAKAYIAAGGGDPEKDAELVAIGSGPDAAAVIEAGRVDAYVGTDGNIAQTEQVGVALRPLEVPPDAPIAKSGFQVSFFTSADALKDKHDELVALGRGVAKGSIFAKANPKCAVYDLWKVYPETKPTGVPDEKALEQAMDILEIRQTETEPVNGKWGALEPGSIEAVEEVLTAAKVLDEALPVDQVWTDELIDEINQFDAEAVEEDARAATCGPESGS